MTAASPIELVYSLIGFPYETEWLEFKVGNKSPERIGEDISALANSAAWLQRDAGYKVWGVDDTSHELVGTTFDPVSAKAAGNQYLSIWLKRMLTPNASYRFEQFEHEGKHFVILTVRPASDQPVCFQGQAYIREGSVTTKLTQGSRREAELWHRLQRANYEGRVAQEDLTLEEVGALLDVGAFFDLMGLRAPTGLDSVVRPLADQGLIRVQDNGYYAVTNLGALLLAHDLGSFDGLQKRAVRVVRFEDKGSRKILSDKTFSAGYVASLPQAEEHIMSLVPADETTDGMFRRIRYAYPQKAIREMLSNMVLHQDLSVTTQGPLVGIYQNRIELSNPGTCLIQTERVLNDPPKTRNDALVRLMRQMDFCEEGGTGWDIAVAECESAHMLPPKMRSEEEMGTRVVLFAGNSYERMTKAERLDALYWHACLQYADSESMSNQSLRERFGLDESGKHSLAMSRLIRDACDAGLVKIEDESVGTKNRRYIPAWA